MAGGGGTVHSETRQLKSDAATEARRRCIRSAVGNSGAADVSCIPSAISVNVTIQPSLGLLSTVQYLCIGITT